MKKLIIVRHAKSSWKDLSLRDFQRPLNKRGKNDGPIMAAYLNQRFKEIDFLHSSSSVRTFQTSKFFTSIIKFGEIRFDDNLYHCSLSSLLELIKNYSNNFNSVLIVAHNPGLTNLINYLTKINIDNLPTLGIAELNCSLQNWSDISTKNCNLVDIKFPKQLK